MHKHDKAMTLYIPLLSIDSEQDALIIQSALENILATEQVTVELNNLRAVIDTQNPNEVLPKAVEKIRQLGYQVPSVTKTYPVTNLACASCAGNAEAVLNSQIGVVKAAVNYANSSGKIEYIPSLISSDVMKSAVQSAGYDMVVDESDEAKENLENIKKNHYQKLRKKVIGALFFAIPLFVIGMFFMDKPWANIVMWILSTPMLFYFGQSFFIGAWKQLKHRSANMDTLVAISTGTAYIYSVFATVLPKLWHQNGIHPHVYFEAAGIVIAFILLGKLLEEKAKGNTSSAIKKLMGIQPKTVTVIHDNHEETVAISQVKIGDKILVKPGERIAVDGIVSSGQSYVDESMINGEAVAVLKKKSEKVYAGTINQKGSFHFEAQKVGGDTVLAQIIKAVEDAQGSKAPIQKTVDKIARIFVPIVLSIAVLSFIIWMIFGGENAFTQALIAFVTVLVIACPCALGLATPTAIMVGIGKGAEQGILIKNAESIELARKVNTVILDKTGTITEGKPSVNELIWTENKTDEWQNILYSIEKVSEHPLADAIVNHLQKNSHLLDTVEIENIAGQGIKGRFQQQNYYVGNPQLIHQKGIEITDNHQQKIDQKLAEAQTVVLFCNEQKVLAIISITDQIKSTSAKAISDLQAANIDVFMLTGDNEQTAKSVANQLHIDQYKAGVLPAEKADFVKQLQQQNKIVAMVGDGINDSTALAQADVSIAMGKGSDIAMDVAKMTIISSDLNKILMAIKLSKYTSRAIHQNLFWAFIYNVIGIPVAAGLLYPINGFLLNPMWAGAAMALSSVSVVSNSLRLKWKSLKN